jgi:hypothetical protein
MRPSPHTTRILSRSFTTSSTVLRQRGPSDTGALPAAKMRALISLYHNAESFISPAGLSDAIDAAFIQRSKDNASVAEMTYGDLRQVLKERTTSPRTHVESDAVESSRVLLQDWSNENSARQEQVLDALYGTVQKQKPGLEVVLENGERLEKEIREDRETYASR